MTNLNPSARQDDCPFFIEFEAGDTERFAKRVEVFAALRAAK